MPFPTAQQVNFPACSPHCPFNAERQAGNVYTSVSSIYDEFSCVTLFFSFHTGLLITFLYKLCCYFKLPFSNFEMQEGIAEQIATTMHKLRYLF